MCCRLSSLVGIGAQIPAGPAAMQLVHVDLFTVEEVAFHMADKGRQAAVPMACFQLPLRLSYDSYADIARVKNSDGSQVQ